MRWRVSASTASASMRSRSESTSALCSGTENQRSIMGASTSRWNCRAQTSSP